MRETIYLKQQTPMWHFQPEIPGCCLRATEVKPKLDRFLLEHYPDDKVLVRVGDTDALDYKLSFEVGDDEMYDLDPKKFTLYFGNMGEGTPEKKLVFYKKPIMMRLFSLNMELIEHIKKHLNEFFATHSFGTRQDKGFGYFFPEGQDFNEAFNAKYKINFDLTLNPYSYKEQQNKKDIVTIKLYEELFKYIEYFHKIIRSGINENGKCYDSFLKKFVEKKLPKDEHGNIMMWDKPLIRYILQYENERYLKKCGQEKTKKEDKFKVSPKIKREDKECEKYRDNKGHLRLFREMLGLASSQDWEFYDDTIKISEHVEEGKTKTITRFKSPIEYRPYFKINKETDSIAEFNVTIYIDYDEKPIEEFKKYAFDIQSNHNFGKNGISRIKNAKPYQGFYLKDYFDFIYQEYMDCQNSGVLRYINGATATRKFAKNPKKTKKADEYINDMFDPFTISFYKL